MPFVTHIIVIIDQKATLNILNYIVYNHLFIVWVPWLQHGLHAWTYMVDWYVAVSFKLFEWPFVYTVWGVHAMSASPADFHALYCTALYNLYTVCMMFFLHWMLSSGVVLNIKRVLRYIKAVIQCITLIN